MVLRDVDGSLVWKTDLNSTTTNHVERAELLNSGNLVLKDPQGNILWQSFHFPTDTLLPNQLFTKGMKLVSNKLGRGNFGSGYYSLYFDNNVLRLMFDDPDTSSIYWPDPGMNVYQNGRADYNSSRIAVFDEIGNFLSSDQLKFSAGDMGLGPKRRLTIDYDGNLRLYSLNATAGFWLVTWEALIQSCTVHGICGRNAICVYTPEPKCSYPPGYEMLNKGNWNEGCKPKFNLTCSEPVKFVEIRNMDFYGFDLNYSESTTFDHCKNLCTGDCRCQAFLYKLGGQMALCYTKGVLFNGYKSPNQWGNMFLKLPVSADSSLRTLIHA